MHQVSSSGSSITTPTEASACCIDTVMPTFGSVRVPSRSKSTTGGAAMGRGTLPAGCDHGGVMAGQDLEPITKDELSQPLFRLIPVVAVLAVMWLVEIIDVPLDGDLDRFGI